MPAIPPGLSKRIDSLEASTNRRFDELREDVKDLQKKVDELSLKIMEMLRKAPR